MRLSVAPDDFISESAYAESVKASDFGFKKEAIRGLKHFSFPLFGPSGGGKGVEHNWQAFVFFGDTYYFSQKPVKFPSDPVIENFRYFLPGAGKILAYKAV
jgi:hypothetical protein